MSVLWKKTEFYKGESDCEGIIIAAGGLREDADNLQQAGFPIMGALHSHQIFLLLMKVLVLPIITWNWTQNESILKRTLRKCSACGHFYENLQFKNFWSPLFKRIYRGMSPTYWANPNGKPWQVQERALAAFQGTKNIFVLLFNVFQAVWMGYNDIKNYINGLKSYASSKPTCFSWLIIRLLAEYNITWEEFHAQLPS